MILALTSKSTIRRYSPQLVKRLGQAGARHLVKHRQTIGLEARHAAIPEGRAGGQRQQMGQEIGNLIEQINAQIFILNADMHMHAANQQTPRGNLHILGQQVIALALRMGLFSHSP